MIVIRNASVVTGDPAGRRWDTADIVIDGEVIAAIGPDAGRAALGAGHPVEVIEGTDRIAIPGLVNAHLHSNETFEQGVHDNAPLELWLARCYPPLAPPTRLPERTHYLRAMMCCAQSLRSGVTTVQDDLLNPGGDPAVLDGAMTAYRDAGLKASVAVTFTDRPYLDAYPWLREIVPTDILSALEALPVRALAAQVADFAAFRQKWHGAADGRLRLILGPRGPQRCTSALGETMAGLSADHDLPVHMHVLESRTQAATAQIQYGKTFVAVLKDWGLLTPRLTLNHAVWLTEDDIAALGSAGCCTTHNPLSNMKLGSGISPVRRLTEAGVTVALGTDGPTTSDTADQIQVLRAASLLHKLTDIEPERWITAEDVLRMATRNGARSCGRATEIGSLEPGKKADVVLLDAKHWGFIPLNDPVRQLAYSVTSDAVDTVIADGRVLMKDRRILAFDEDAIREEVRAEAERFRREVLPVNAAAAARLEPYVREMYARAMRRPVPATANPRFVG